MLNYLYNLATDRYRGFLAGSIKMFLFILSVFYGLVIRLLMFCAGFSPFRASCKVISVGNITLGGTGKTPLVEYIAKLLQSNGRKVAVISRGYKGTNKNPADEPSMLQEKLKGIPIIADADRKAAIKKAVNDFAVDTVILDDGFQQWAVTKDLEIVAVDAVKPFGNWNMLPRGILRQPLSSLKKADIFVITNVSINPDIGGLKQELKKINPLALVVACSHNPSGFYALAGKNGESIGPEQLKGKSAALVCGIAHPEYFEKTVFNLGVNKILSFQFPDHHQYSQKEWEDIERECEKNNVEIILTTEKDAARMNRSIVKSPRFMVLVLRIEIKIIENEEKFHSRLSGFYNL